MKSSDILPNKVYTIESITDPDFKIYFQFIGPEMDKVQYDFRSEDVYDRFDLALAPILLCGKDYLENKGLVLREATDAETAYVALRDGTGFGMIYEELSHG